MHKTLISIQGPTASGKTSLALALAERLGIEIISADSRQFYRELNIGTAKPAEHELQKVKHHFISFLSVQDEYHASNYEKAALQKIEEIFARNKWPVLAGGSGLYVQAVLKGFDKIPDVPSSIRKQVLQEYQQKGIGSLLKELMDCDPVYYNKVDKQNFRRVLRAVEIYRATGKPYSGFRKANYPPRPFNTVKVALHFPKENLYRRIDQRCEKMLEDGLIDEARKLYSCRMLPALQTIGYQEFFDYFDGQCTRDEAIAKFRQHSRNYAKRQISWLKRDEGITWFRGDNRDEIIRFITDQID